MMKQLPAWVEYGAFALAWIAGFTNAVALLSLEHQAVSHVSGTATQFGVAVWEAQPAQLVHLGAILLSFFVGATLSGLFLKGTSLQLGRQYEIVLALEAGFLFLAFLLLRQQSVYGHYAASVACGLQNAMATSYSGAIVRTTHLTGILTDLGLMLGAKLRGELFDSRRAGLFLLILVGFIVGGTCGAWGEEHFGETSLLVPSALCLLMALTYRAHLIK